MIMYQVNIYKLNDALVTTFEVEAADIGDAYLKANKEVKKLGYSLTFTKVEVTKE